MKAVLSILEKSLLLLPCESERKKAVLNRITVLVCAMCLPAVAGDLDVVRHSQELRRAGDYQGAEKLLRDALASGMAPENRILALNDLADLLREQDHRAEARTLFNEALHSPGVRWAQTFASNLGLADLDRQDQQWNSAVSRLTFAADLAREHKSYLLEAFALRSLGETWMNAGNTARAEPLLRKALATLEVSPDVPKERVAIALDSLGALYRIENKTALAEDAWLRELEIHRAMLGDYHPQTAMVMGRLAELWSSQGDYEKARAWSQRTVDVMVGKFGQESEASASAMVNAALIEQRANHLETAAGMYSRALEIYRAKNGDDISAREVAQMYAGVLSQQHKGREAKQIMAAFHLK
jgi:tetratricopeptide (TPR) repeat protein